MQKSRTSSLRQVQMPDVDPIIIPFVTTIVMDKKNQKLIIKELNKCLADIENKNKLLVAARDSLIKKQSDLISSFENINYPDFPSPQYVWSKKKCQHLYIKYYKCLINFYEEKLKIVDVLIPFIKNCIEQSTAIKIEMDRFDKATNVGQDEKVDKALTKYTRMNNYVNYIESKGLNETCRYGDVKRSQVWAKMKEVAENYEKNGPYEGSSNKKRYFPPTEFDEIFMKFILVTKISDKFKICVKSMPKYGTYEDFKKTSFDQSLHSSDISTVNTSNDNILKCSLKNIQISIDNITSEDTKTISDNNNDQNANIEISSDNKNNTKGNESNVNEKVDADSSTKNDNDNKNVSSNDQQIVVIKLQDDGFLSSDDEYSNNSDKENVVETEGSNSQDQVIFHRKKSVIEEIRLQSLMDQNIDTENFRNFVLSLFRLLKTNKPCTQAMLQLFHCAVIRILFDFYYIENSAILYGRNLKDFYLAICEEILNENPLQVNLGKKFFAQGEDNLPMRQIINNDPILSTGSSALFMIQFLNNPLDMAIQVNRTFRIIQESVDTKKFDQNQQDVNVSSQMTSDDFINMMKPLYALNPYVCPSGVCRFIELFCELFQLFDTLSYGLTTFSIVLRDIEDMANKKEKSLYNENQAK